MQWMTGRECVMFLIADLQGYLINIGRASHGLYYKVQIFLELLFVINAEAIEYGYLLVFFIRIEDPDSIFSLRRLEFKYI